MAHLLWLSLLIPIIIHLVFRRRAKPMEFGTLYFLRLVDRQVMRRHRLKELLLLALRLLLLAAMIGALIKHTLDRAVFGGRSVPTSAAIVLDNTCSMRASLQGGQAFALARAAARSVLEGLGEGSTATLVPFDAPGDSPARPTSFVDELRKDIDGMGCGYGTARLARPLRRTLASLELSTEPRKELYILTDMQKLAWAGDLDGLREAVPDDVPIFLVDVGQDVTGNLAVENVNFGLKVTVRGAVSTLYCEVRNTGPSGLARKLTLFVRDRKVAEQEVTVAAGGRRTVVFTHVFEETGLHHGRVEFDADDFEPDNRRYFTARVREKLPVLVVNGGPSVIPYRDAAFYLKVALDATSRRGERHSPLEAEIVSEGETASRTLGEYGCVILVDVARVEPPWARQLAAYVSGGGGLLIFCGSRVDAASYDVTLGGVGEEAVDLLPAGLTRAVSASAREDPFFRIVDVDVRHPVLRDISAEIAWDTTQVKRFFRTEPADEEGDATHVLLSLGDGPLLLERKVGSGTVMLFTGTCTPEWGNVPLKAYFLPLVHQIVYYMSRARSEAASTPVGMAYGLKLPEARGEALVKFIPPEQKAESPGDEPPLRPVELTVAPGEDKAVFHETLAPGIYHTEAHVAGKTVRGMFAVNVPPRESELERLSTREAEALLDLDNLKVVAGPERLAAVVARERQGLPLWDYLLLVTIMAAVVETFVANVVLKH